MTRRFGPGTGKRKFRTLVDVERLPLSNGRYINFVLIYCQHGQKDGESVISRSWKELRISLQEKKNTVLHVRGIHSSPREKIDRMKILERTDKFIDAIRFFCQRNDIDRWSDAILEKAMEMIQEEERKTTSIS